MNIFKTDYCHMFWYMREYMWIRQIEKLNNTINYEESPFCYLIEGLCMVVISAIFSLLFAFEYIVLEKGHGADLVGYMMYCDKKIKRGKQNGFKRKR